MREYIKEILGSGEHKQNNNTTTLIISNDEIKDIIEIVKSLEDSGLLLEGVSETFKMKLKNKKEYFLVCCLVHWVQAY